MNLITSQFKVDLISFNQTSDKPGLVEAHVRNASSDLGLKVIAMIHPFEKIEDESFHGEVPNFSMNREHHFTDTYRTQFYTMTTEEYKNICALVKELIDNGQVSQNQKERFITLLTYNK